MTGKISKSEMKRRFKQVEEAAAELALLSDNDLKKLPASDLVKEEIVACRSVKAGARKRQIKYLARVMREESLEDMLDFLAARKGSRLKDNKLHHEAERIRDLLINEALEVDQQLQAEGERLEPDWESEYIAELAARLEVDEGDLRRAVFQYAKSRVQNHYREVFRMVKAGLEKEDMRKRLEGESSCL